MPGAPVLRSAARGDGQVTLSWEAPTSDGGSPITGYTATAGPGGATCSTSGALGCTVSGLTNGTTYSFTVTATNAVGTGSSSNALSATPATAPGAPTLTSAVPGPSQVALTWEAPASNGGLPVSGYTRHLEPRRVHLQHGRRPLLHRLRAHERHDLLVHGHGHEPRRHERELELALRNARAGRDRPRLAQPDGRRLPATTRSGSRGPRRRTAAPPITGYKVYRGTSSGTETLLATVGSVTGYTDDTAANGTTYFYLVSAVNGVGEGLPSNERSAMPVTMPQAPTLTAAVPGNSVTLTWSPPAGNGGLPITGYNIYRSTVSGQETLLTTVGVVTTYTDETTDDGTTYYFRSPRSTPWARARGRTRCPRRRLRLRPRRLPPPSPAR